MFEKLLDIIREQDHMTEPGYAYFHYDKDKKSRTIIGGLGTLTVAFIVTYIAMYKGYHMVTTDNPAFQTVESKMTDEEKMTVGILNTTRHWIEIQKGRFDHSEDDPLETVELDRDSRRYMKMRLNNVIETYDEDGVMNTENVYYDLTRCNEDYF